MSGFCNVDIKFIKEVISVIMYGIQNGHGSVSSLCIIVYDEDDLQALLKELEYLEKRNNYLLHTVDGSKGLSARSVLEECNDKYGNENPLIIVVKNFDLIDPTEQFRYSKIIRMEDTFLKNKIKDGSVLILLTKKGERMNLKPGWLTVVEFGKDE